MKRPDIPIEINDHLLIYGKESWEIEYNEKCPLCGSRIDEFQSCACDAGGD
ncbi:hypothetical protein [Nitrosopumilus sp.]|uniref:hypothetical protein n=1 Tax=Nitrosopumilus sp. TaxID=2024843 RepID=UPI00262EC93C|nr:hypothetical protein [Nitrosopumilus sp.]